MTHRRTVVKYLLDHGYMSVGATNHEKLVKPGRPPIFLKRHREIDEKTFAKIRKTVESSEL